MSFKDWKWQNWKLKPRPRTCMTGWPCSCWRLWCFQSLLSGGWTGVAMRDGFVGNNLSSISPSLSPFSLPSLSLVRPQFNCYLCGYSVTTSNRWLNLIQLIDCQPIKQYNVVGWRQFLLYSQDYWPKMANYLLRFLLDLVHSFKENS